MSYDSEPKKKPTYTQAIRTIRNEGLPGAKRFRRRTRLEYAKAQHEADTMVLNQAIKVVRDYAALVAHFRNEANWVVRATDEHEVGEIVWVGEKDPMELIKEARLPG